MPGVIFLSSHEPFVCRVTRQGFCPSGVPGPALHDAFFSDVQVDEAREGYAMSGVLGDLCSVDHDVVHSSATPVAVLIAATSVPLPIPPRSSPPVSLVGEGRFSVPPGALRAGWSVVGSLDPCHARAPVKSRECACLSGGLVGLRW